MQIDVSKGWPWGMCCEIAGGKLSDESMSGLLLDKSPPLATFAIQNETRPRAHFGLRLQQLKQGGVK